MSFRSQLSAIIPDETGRVKINEPMSVHTTFRVGGQADYFIEPASIEEIIRVLDVTLQSGLPLTLLGNGSNVVVADRGIRGVVLFVGSTFAQINLDGTTIKAQAGAPLASVAAFAARHGLSGLEFASGIPGTIGGAVMMNAGAYDHCMAEVVSETVFLDCSRQQNHVCGAAHCFAYRQSCFTGRSDIILETTLVLRPDEPAAIWARIAELAKKRRESQPLEYPSAGSAFKRPTGHFAGKLIADCGLKGYRIGGAEVSTKHAGFIINKENASAEEIRQLFVHVQQVVEQQTGVRLEPEVRFIGDWRT